MTEPACPVQMAKFNAGRTPCQASQSTHPPAPSHGDLAKDLGVPAQAIGQACGGNPIGLIIPCHRILGANGLGGFSAIHGVETKVALLKHEGAASLLI